MRILLFNWRDLRHPEAGGAEKHLHEMARRWVAQGHEVTLLCGQPPGGLLPREEVIEGVRVARLGGRYTVYPAVAIAYLLRYRRWADVVVDDVNGVPFFTPLYVKKPKVVIIHHLVKGIFYLELPPLGALIGDLAERLLPALYGREVIVTVSPSTREELVAAGFERERIRIIHHGVDIDLFRPRGDPKYGKNLICLGRLKRYKGLDLVVEAFDEVLSRHPEAHLHIVGQGEERSAVEEQVLARELKDAVTLHGFLPQGALVSLMQRCCLVVTATQKEGWGLTLLEAMASGLPAVAFDVPGVRDVVETGSNGVLVSGRAPGDLARAISDLLNDGEKLRYLGKGARAFAVGFSWDRTAMEYMDLFKATTGEGRRVL